MTKKQILKLNFDKELKQLQIKEIDELIKEYNNLIFDKNKVKEIKDKYQILYLEMKNKYNNSVLETLNNKNRF